MTRPTFTREERLQLYRFRSYAADACYDASEAGRLAYEAKQDVEVNPHAGGSNAWLAWRDGFREAMDANTTSEDSEP